MAKFLIYNRRRFAAFLFYLFCIFFTIFISSCGDGSYDSDSSETASAFFSIEWHDTPASQSSENTRITKALDCEVAGVDTIICEVYDESNTLLTSENWPCSAGSGTIYNIPVGVCVFVILGEGDGNILYHGETTDITITAGPPTNVGTIDAYSFVPSGLEATAVSDSQIDLSWDALNENVSIDSYWIYRDDVQIGTSTSTSYSDTDLNPATEYCYTVSVYDTFGIESGPSYPGCAMTEASGTCTYSISPTSRSFPSGVGAGSISVTPSASDCDWSATESVGWITITSGSSGSGDGTVTYSVAANTGAARSATITIAGLTHTINQAEGPCTYSISPTSQSVDYEGDAYNVTVTATHGGCDWTTSEDYNWISLSPTSGSGSGSVSVTVSANTGAARSATITIAGQSHTIDQAAAGCTYTIAPTSQSIDDVGGAYDVTVTATHGGCDWTTSEDYSWISLSPTGGSGSGTVLVTVSANIGEARSATITIAGYTHTINQAAADCAYTISPASQSVGYEGDAYNVTVTATHGGCDWTTSEDYSWISLSPTGGSGSGTVLVTVSANIGEARSATITIAGYTHTINQAAADCAYTISPASQSVGYEGDAYNVTVTATHGGCEWTTSEDYNWISLSPTGGSGSGTVLVTVSANTGAARSATITIAGQSHTVTQGSETTPPTPNPMTWAIEPYEMSTSSISMMATTASDPTGPITYYFDYYTSPTGGSGGTDSVWQSSTTYNDSGLGTNHQYGYRVRARDGNDNQTSYSFISYDYTDIETPSGITFVSINNTSFRVMSTNTPSGLTRGSSGLIIYNVTNGANSGWNQNNNYWTSDSLSINTQYGFRALARNGDANTTSYSPTSYRYTLANMPGYNQFSNVTQTSIRANWTANGNPSGTQYYCENQTEGTNSGWTTNTYWDSANLTCSTSYQFRVRARNGDGLETGWTDLGVQATATCPDITPPTPNPMTWAAVPYETSTSSISMVATTASDPSTPISYYFTYSSLTGGTGGTSSGWQTSTAYTDSGLSVNHQYRYWVQARDNLGNTTAWSSYSDDYTDIETPSGITFSPDTITNSSIQVRSTNTPSGLTRGSSGLYIYNYTTGANSGWKQNNDYWTSGSLSTNTQYGFRALARNGDGNNTGYSPISYWYTLANMPGYSQFSNVTQTSIRANWTANGNPSGTYYYCENMDNGTNSGWTTNTYWNNTGLDCGASYEYRVMARNGDGLVTSWRYLDNQYTQDCTGFRFDTNNDRWRMVGLYDGGGLDPIWDIFSDVSAPYLPDYGSPSPGSIALGTGGGSFPSSSIPNNIWLHWDLNSPDLGSDAQWQDMSSLSYRITGQYIWTSLTPIYVQTVLHVRNPDLQESYFAGGFHVINEYWEIITEDVSSWGMLPGTRILDINLRIFFQAAPIGATSSYEGYVLVDHVVPRH